MSKKRILILGAGLAGLSAAWHLQRKGYDCQIFEKEAEVGGLCRSKKINGFTFDCSGHLLHFKHKYTFRLIKDLLGENLVRHNRSAWIYSFGRFNRYPFQANLYGLPKSIIKECLLQFLKVHRNGSKISEARHPNINKINKFGGLTSDKKISFQQWIDKTFGKGIAHHFMVPYNTKFWTVPPQELTCEWLDGFIPIPSLNQIIEGTVEESHRQLGYNVHFWYPKRGGINEVPLAFARQIKNVYTDCKIVEINLDKKEIKLPSGDRERFDYLISTIPLPEMPYLIKGLPREINSLFKKLRWNSIFNLNLGIEEKDYSKRHWIYFPEKEYSFFRVGFFHNFSSALTSPDKSSLYVEVSYSAKKTINKSNIVLRIKEDLKKASLLPRNNKIYAEDINDIKYGYPIYDKNYHQSREGILKFLAQNNIISCGRYGSWRYMSMEDVILDGKRVANFVSKSA